MYNNIIPYGIDRNYIADWGLNDALREICQNFIDYGEYKTEVDDAAQEGQKTLVFKNSFSPEFLDYLKIGFSQKEEESRGKHGEGLKMAALVLTRNGLDFSIAHNTIQVTGVFYEDENLGECFGLEVEETNNTEDLFTVKCTLPKEIIEEYNEKAIKPEEVIFSYPGCGDLINKPAGEVYVGGLYVCNLKGLKHAYDFHPTQIKLDRDRKIPASFDVQYTASKILENSGQIKLKDLETDDARYIDKIPEKIAKKFQPEIVQGKVVFRTKDYQATPRVKEILMKNPKVQKKVARMKTGLTRKIKPESIMKEFLDKYKYNMKPEMLTDLQAIVRMAKDWK
jgi:hypothetical protein